MSATVGWWVLTSIMKVSSMQRVSPCLMLNFLLILRSLLSSGSRNEALAFARKASSDRS